MSGILGGSALYFALAATLVAPVRLVAPVGRLDEDLVRARLAGRDVDLVSLSVLDAPTYRWQARQTAGRTLDLGSRDSIYDVWRPRLPKDWTGWAFVGSMRPDLQIEVARGLRGRAGLLAADAMLSYVQGAPEQSAELLGLCDWFFANEQELQALGGDPARPDRFREARGLRGLVVKRGAGGVSAYTGAVAVDLPALDTQVLDTTGAGDSLAGAMLGRWSSVGGGPDRLADALRHGRAAASIAIEGLGLSALAAAEYSALAARLD